MEADKNKNDQNVPSIDQLLEWETEGIAQATDGCYVEPDGICEHGCKSWFIVLGLI
jgi:hypothetical protein